MATRQNHRKRHQTIEDKRDAGMLLLIADRVKHDGYPPTEAGVRRWLKRHSVRRWLASDEAALVMAHVNTAAPPMRRVHPGQDVCRGEFPRVAKPVVVGLAIVDAATAHAIQQCRALVLEMKGWRKAA